jgi:hypothetical protein
LKCGEIAICSIPGDDDEKAMIKVGDGVTKFKNLDWLYGKAADVHDWAKQSINDHLTNNFGVKTSNPILSEVVENGTKLNYYHEKVNDGSGTITGTLPSTTGDATISLTPGGSAATELVVPYVSVDEYGHATYTGEMKYTFTLPAEAVHSLSLTSVTNGVKVDHKKGNTSIGDFSIVSVDTKTATVSLAADNKTINVDVANVSGEVADNTFTVKQGTNDVGSVTIEGANGITASTSGNTITLTGTTYTADEEEILLGNTTTFKHKAHAVKTEADAENKFIKNVTVNGFGHIEDVSYGTVVEEDTKTKVKSGDGYIKVTLGEGKNFENDEVNEYTISADEVALRRLVGGLTTAAMIFKGCIITK